MSFSTQTLVGRCKSEDSFSTTDIEEELPEFCNIQLVPKLAKVRIFSLDAG